MLYAILTIYDWVLPSLILLLTKKNFLFLYSILGLLFLLQMHQKWALALEDIWCEGNRSLA